MNFSDSSEGLHFVSDFEEQLLSTTEETKCLNVWYLNALIPYSSSKCIPDQI